jgi:hypothetical protein
MMGVLSLEDSELLSDSSIPVLSISGKIEELAGFKLIGDNSGLGRPTLAILGVPYSNLLELISLNRLELAGSSLLPSSSLFTTVSTCSTIRIGFSIIGEDPTTSLSFLLALICSNRLEIAVGFSGETSTVGVTSCATLVAIASSLSFQSFLNCSIKLGPAGDTSFLGSSLVKY